MIKLSKCCVIFPLRPGCVAIGIVFTLLSLLGAINKVIQISLFAKSLNGRFGSLDTYDDTRLARATEAGIIRFSFVLLVELLICCSAIAFVYGIVKERLRFMPPFIVHLSLKVGYYAVHYFDVGTKHIERDDVVGALRLYTFGVIVCCIFCYLWLCAYSSFLQLKGLKDARSAIREGILHRGSIL